MTLSIETFQEGCTLKRTLTHHFSVIPPGHLRHLSDSPQAADNSLIGYFLSLKLRHSQWGKWQTQLLLDVGTPQTEDEWICRGEIMHVAGHASTLAC